METSRLLIEPSEAHELLAESASRLGALGSGTDLATDQALGCYLAEAVMAACDSPPCHLSAMDGIAFAHCGLERYRLVGTIAAGDRPDALVLGAGECARIMTGAALPPGADTVEMVEKIQVDGTEVRLKEDVVVGQHVRFQGENIRAGEMLFPEGRRVSPAVLAALISQGIRRVRPRRRLRLGIAATGDELLDYRRPPTAGKIYDSNAHGLAALFEGPAFEVQRLGVCGDDAVSLSQLLAQQLDLDLILLSGGVSMGAFDFVPSAAEAAGFQPLFHKVKMKPGKPLWVGLHPGGTTLFGLPGNPVSVQLTATLFALPFALARLSGTYAPPRFFLCPSCSPLSNPSSLTHFLPAAWSHDEGRLAVSPLPTAGSGDIARFANAQALIALPPRVQIQSGGSVQVLLPNAGDFG